jgi:four helix bundle protein
MKSNQGKASELEERLIQFAVQIIEITNKLPGTSAGRHIAGQILRSGTAPAPNYGEARGAESMADFVHKLGVVLKELNETLIWLKIIKRSKLIKGEVLDNIADENSQLAKIIISSIQTARKNKKK